ncbi:MAG: 2-oxoisovalerate dehydrogenase subunit beta [Chlamydiae bacterium]|nr:2-oxoisovalerate dehydrogenase subunit beta [Chlamydiota bacterium]
MGDAKLSTEKALKVYKLMVLSRLTDEKMAKLAKQNKGGTFQLSSAGHELVGVVMGQSLIPGKDWSFPYYRDQGFALSIGSDLVELFGAFLGRATKNHSSGRMMPYHYSHKELRIFCQSSVVGSQFIQAAGKGLGIKNLKKDEVVYVSAGDGATSQGDFHEALNFASIHKLPVIFVIQNNGWAISVPAEEQSAGGSLVPVCKGYEGLEVHDVDGTDYEELSAAVEKAVDRGRSQKGPSVIMAHVPRLAPHSNSDDPKKYQTAEIIEAEQKRDPIPRFEKWLIAEGHATAEQIEALRSAAHEEVEKAAAEAEKLPFPEKGSSSQHLFKPYDPPTPLLSETSPTPEAEKIVIAEALNQALAEEMELDPHVVVFGQDVANGKGGVFGITRALTEKFGKSRCFNSPLAESTIVGVAIGLVADGMHKAVAEIQFSDYIWTGINQLFNEAASIHYRSAGVWDVPIVIRTTCGGYIQGGPYHSQSVEGFLTHCPGLKVVIPSNAADAKGLLKTAIRDPNPVVFLEHKALYRQQKFCARPEPSKETLIPFGQASIVREGSDLTIVCWGMMVVKAWEVSEKLAAEGISVEIIDLRTLVPLDMATIITSVQKTGKVLIAHEAPRNCGFGAELAARIAEEAFESLDGPIHRVCGQDTPVPYSKPMEDEVLPQSQDLLNAIHHLIKY